MVDFQNYRTCLGLMIVFASQFLSHVTVRADEATYTKAAEQLQKIRDVKGSSIDNLDYEDIVMPISKQMTQNEKERLLKMLENFQAKPIKRSAIINIYETEILPLISYKVDYSMTKYNIEKKYTEKMKARQFSQKGNLLYDMSYVSLSNSKENNHKTFSFFDNIVRIVDTEKMNGSINLADGGQPTQQFFPSDGILGASLFYWRQNIKLPYGSSIYRLLQRNATVVLGGTYKVNGENCVKVVSSVYTAYLIPDKSFMVARFEESDGRQYSNDKPLKRPRILSYESNCLDYRRIEGNIWFPQRSIQKRYNDGKVLNIVESTMQDVSINKTISDSEFKDIFPTGVIIYNGIEKKSYVYNNDPSIGKSLQVMVDYNTSSTRRRNYWPYVLLANIVAFCGLTLAIYLRRRKKRVA